MEKSKREDVSGEQNTNGEQFEGILANLAGATYRCMFDEMFTVKYISDKIFDISGYPATDFIENRIRSYASIIHPDDLEICFSNISAGCSNNTHYEFEYRIRHKNGEIIWVSENGKGILDDTGDIDFLDGIIIDITRRKVAELAVQESERNYKELIDFLPQPVFELDLDGKILLLNRAGEDFFGPVPVYPDKLASAIEFFIKEDIPHVIEQWTKSASGINTEPREFTVIKIDGTLCPVLIFGSPIKRNGIIIGRRGIIVDISERKKYEMRLVDARNELQLININLEQIVAERTRDLTEVNTKLLKVQKENLQSQFEVLKSQINPHFMFNSLNVLSGLINVDIDKAQLFIDEFSQIYRYVLETIEQTVVTLNEELEFMRSYLFLSQIRYGKSLTYTVNILAEKLQLLVPPLSLQVLLENAIKHNIVNESKPLEIEILSQGDYLIVKNPIQLKISGTSTGLGLKNLIKRYSLISKLEPTFMVVNNHYVASIPLINIDQDERTNN